MPDRPSLDLRHEPVEVDEQFGKILQWIADKLDLIDRRTSAMSDQSAHIQADVAALTESNRALTESNTALVASVSRIAAKINAIKGAGGIDPAVLADLDAEVAAAHAAATGEAAAATQIGHAVGS